MNSFWTQVLVIIVAVLIAVLFSDYMDRKD